MNRLTVFLNTSDISNEMEDYLLDTSTMTLLTTDEISVGYYKPINKLYLELEGFNTNDSALQLYFYNGTSFITTPVKDDSKGFYRSGFISWDRNLTNEAKTTVNGVEAYWYKLKLNADSTELQVAGLNLVFSSDNDLKEEYPSVMEMLPELSEGVMAKSFIGFHVATRKDILSYFKSQGKLILDAKNLSKKAVDQFDLLNIEEVRDASKFLTLAKIFYWISDAVGDKWHEKGKYFEEKYTQKISMANLSLDSNDDGKAQPSELNAVSFIRIQRV